MLLRQAQVADLAVTYRPVSGVGKMIERPPTPPQPEWAPHEAVWIGFPSHPDLWVDDLEPAEERGRGVRRAVHADGRGEKVLLVAADEGAAASARALGALRGGRRRAVRRHLAARHRADRPWRRQEPSRAGFGFNGWGGKYDLAGDDDDRRAAGGGRGAARRESATGCSKAARSTATAPGSCVTTEQCLLNPNRNPADAGRDRGAAAQRSRLRASPVARRRAAQRPYRRPCRQSRALRRAGAGRDPERGGGRSQRGGLPATPRRAPTARRGSRSSPCPRPAACSDEDGEIVPASYMNFYIGNAAVVVPLYGARQRRRGGRGDAGAVPRPRGDRPARRPHPDRRRQLPLHHPAGARMTEITVAALQLAFTDDIDAQHRAPSRELVREAAAKGAQVDPAARTVRGPLFLPGRGRGPVRQRRARSASTRRCWRCRRSPRELKVYDPDQLLRGGRAAPLQQPRDDRPRRRGRRASIARATSPTARAMRRNSISAPATPASRSGTARAGDARRRRLLGPMVSRNRARDDADGRRDPVLPDRDRQRAARSRPRHRAAVAARDGRPCGVERRAGRRRQPHRHRARPDASTAPASSPTSAATSSPSSAPRKRA